MCVCAVHIFMILIVCMHVLMILCVGVCVCMCVCVCVCAHTEGGSLAERMKVTLDDHSQQGTSLWDGFMGSSRHTPR